ncbi:MAG: DUF799 family lipoprotein [Thermodesulfobacteriota bacterium]|nr:DUF799 family lipoprotein [Thermodesulfobacteriota bacterium]
MMRQARTFVILFSIVTLFAGCAMPVMIQPNPANPIHTLAVLPLVNDTTDVEAPQMVREKLAEAISKYHYNVMPIAETDVILRDRMGITLGGQLEAATVAKLKENLKVDGLIYGTLMDFTEVTTGLYNVRKVRGKFRLVNAGNGRTMWQNGIGIKSENKMSGNAGLIADAAADVTDHKSAEGVPWVTISNTTSNRSFGETLAINLGVKLLSKATNTHLARETDEMIKRVLSTLPAGPGAGVIYAAPTATPPAMMPPAGMAMAPSVGHMDFGDRDFKAKMVFTHTGPDKETMTWEMPVAKAGKKIRLEMDYNQMLKDQGAPVHMQKMITICRGDKNKTYALYPDQKKYLAYNQTDDPVFKEPKIDKSKVGSETIDGHPTDKYRVKIYMDDGTYTGYIWNARDLDNMTIKTVTTYQGTTSTTLMKNIKLMTPPGSLFEIPAGYSETDNMMFGVSKQ